MAGNDIKFENTKIKLQEIPVSRLLIRRVVRNNNTSGKLTLPKELVGKEVYVFLPK